MIFGYEKKDWPLAILTAEGKPNNETEISSMLEGWSELYKQSQETNKNFRFLIDVRQVPGIDIKYLIMIGKFLKTNKSETERWMEKTGILVSSNTIRLLIKFVFTIYKPVRPFKVFNEPEEALQWVLNDEEGDSAESINKLKEKLPVKESSISFE